MLRCSAPCWDEAIPQGDYNPILDLQIGQGESEKQGVENLEKICTLDILEVAAALVAKTFVVPGLDYLMLAQISLYYIVGQTYPKNSACPSPSVTVFRFFIFKQNGEIKVLDRSENKRQLQRLWRFP